MTTTSQKNRKSRPRVKPQTGVQTYLADIKSRGQKIFPATKKLLAEAYKKHQGTPGGLEGLSVAAEIVVQFDNEADQVRNVKNILNIPGGGYDPRQVQAKPKGLVKADNGVYVTPEELERQLRAAEAARFDRRFAHSSTANPDYARTLDSLKEDLQVAWKQQTRVQKVRNWIGARLATLKSVFSLVRTVFSWARFRLSVLTLKPSTFYTLALESRLLKDGNDMPDTDIYELNRLIALAKKKEKSSLVLAFKSGLAKQQALGKFLWYTLYMKGTK